MVSTPGFPDPEKFCLWNPLSENSFHVESETWALESCIFLTIGIGNPSSTDKESRILVLGIRNPQCRIQNPGLSLITQRGTTPISVSK